MPKYHINQTTGRVNICRAVKKPCPLKTENGEHVPHFDSKEDAKQHVEQQHRQKFDTFNTFKKHCANSTIFSEKEISQKNKIMQHLSSFGYDVRKISEKDRFIHSVTDPANLSEAGKISDAGESIGFPDKPKNALWLSPEKITETGEKTTSWLKFCEFEDFKNYDEGAHQLAIFDPEATILALDENIVKNINKHSESSIKHWDEDQSIADFDYIPNTVDWVHLKNIGIDAVKVDGGVSRDHFYGWDAETVVVLNGKAVRGFDNSWKNF